LLEHLVNLLLGVWTLLQRMVGRTAESLLEQDLRALQLGQLGGDALESQLGSGPPGCTVAASEHQSDFVQRQPGLLPQPNEGESTNRSGVIGATALQARGRGQQPSPFVVAQRRGGQPKLGSKVTDHLHMLQPIP
jgi:hypothetical protein